jgi:hypothetical protein
MSKFLLLAFRNVFRNRRRLGFRRYAARPEARRDFANWLGTFVNFMRTPISLGYNPERLDRELRFPIPPVPRLAMANERWKVEPGVMSRSLVRGSA